MSCYLNGDIYLRRRIPYFFLTQDDVSRIEDEVNRIIDTGNRTQKSINMRKCLKEISDQIKKNSIPNSLYKISDMSYMQEFYTLSIEDKFKLISITKRENRDVMEYNTYFDLNKDFISLYELLNSGNYIGKMYKFKDLKLPLYVAVLYEKDGVCLTEVLDLFLNHIKYSPQQVSKIFNSKILEFDGNISDNKDLTRELYRNILKEMSVDAKDYNKQL